MRYEYSFWRTVQCEREKSAVFTARHSKKNMVFCECSSKENKRHGQKNMKKQKAGNKTESVEVPFKANGNKTYFQTQ